MAEQLLAERPMLEVGPTKNLESKKVGSSSLTLLEVLALVNATVDWGFVHYLGLPEAHLQISL